jgi:hypothetical protein
LTPTDSGSPLAALDSRLHQRSLRRENYFADRNRLLVVEHSDFVVESWETSDMRQRKIIQ